MAPGDDINIRVRLLEAARARADALRVAGGFRQIGTDANYTAGAARRMGAAVDSASRLAHRGLSALATTARYGAAGIAGLAAAGTKWGLQFNAQVESSRLRFKLFTNDVDGLTRAVQDLDMRSAFNFGDLSDAAALLGNSGVQDVPNVLQAAANAAAASGKGLPALQGIVTALSQIQAKGRLSQEEINQLNEAGAPGAQRIIQKAFGLTKDEVGNLGAQGLSAKKALAALTEDWTSGRMAKAAEDQTKTLGGQWSLLTGNLQKASGAATAGLAAGLSHDVLPAANRAAQAITAIFGDKGLSDTEKLRRARHAIERELGPVWDALLDDLDDADIPGHVGQALGAALPKVAAAAGHLGTEAAGAFVDAWLHAGPFAQLASALYLGNKLRKLGGGGGGGPFGRGGIGGLFSRARPIPVWVVNGPGGSPYPGGRGGGGRGGLGRVLDAGKRAAPLVGRVGLAAGAVAGTEAVKDHFAPNIDTAIPNPIGHLDRIFDALGLSGGRTAAASNPLAYGVGRGGAPIVLENRIENRIQLGEKEVARSVTRTRARADARRAGTSRGPQGLPG